MQPAAQQRLLVMDAPPGVVEQRLHDRHLGSGKERDHDRMRPGSRGPTQTVVDAPGLRAYCAVMAAGLAGPVWLGMSSGGRRRGATEVFPHTAAGQSFPQQRHGPSRHRPGVAGSSMGSKSPFALLIGMLLDQR